MHLVTKVTLLFETFLSHIINTACIICDMFTNESVSARGLYYFTFQLHFRKRRSSQGHSQSRTL